MKAANEAAARWCITGPGGGAAARPPSRQFRSRPLSDRGGRRRGGLARLDHGGLVPHDAGSRPAADEGEHGAVPPPARRGGDPAPPRDGPTRGARPGERDRSDCVGDRPRDDSRVRNGARPRDRSAPLQVRPRTVSRPPLPAHRGRRGPARRRVAALRQSSTGARAPVGVDDSLRRSARLRRHRGSDVGRRPALSHAERADHRRRRADRCRPALDLRRHVSGAARRRYRATRHLAWLRAAPS